MKISFEKDKAYIEALKALWLSIKSDYRDGGWLPSVRKISNQLNISVGTYSKAIRRLVSEGIAENYPRKGIYIVPEKYRREKIGVVLCNGEESPFLLNPDIFSEILLKTKRAEVALHLIQGSPVSNIPRNVLSHYVNAAVWISPHSTAYRVIKEIHDRKLFPIIVVNNIQPSSSDDTLHGDVPLISEDYQNMTTAIFEFMTARHHKSVLYLGDRWFAEHIGLDSRFLNSGIAFDSFQDNPHKREYLSEKIKASNVTALVIEGTARRVETVFEELSKLEKKNRPDVIVRDFFQLTELRRKYHTINVIGVADEKSGILGTAAAKQLLAHLRSGRELTSAKVATYSITAQSQ